MGRQREKINREIYEYGEIEGEAERAMLFMESGGLLHRICAWVVRQCAEARADLREERDQ